MGFGGILTIKYLIIKTQINTGIKPKNILYLI